MTMKKDVKIRLGVKIRIGSVFANIGLADLIYLGQIAKVLASTHFPEKKKP